MPRTLVFLAALLAMPALAAPSEYTLTTLEGLTITVVARPATVAFRGDVGCDWLQSGETPWTPARLGSRFAMAAEAARAGDTRVIVEADRDADRPAGVWKVCSIEVTSIGGKVEVSTTGTYWKASTFTLSPSNAQAFGEFLSGVR